MATTSGGSVGSDPLAIARELNVLLPRLSARPRPPELADPFVALVTLADCLQCRIRAEIWTIPVDMRPILVRHRATCGPALCSVVETLSVEAKMIAATAARTQAGQRIVEEAVAAIHQLAEWDLYELSRGTPRPLDADQRLVAFLRGTAHPAAELLSMFGVECAAVLGNDERDQLSPALRTGDWCIIFGCGHNGTARTRLEKWKAAGYAKETARGTWLVRLAMLSPDEQAKMNALTAKRRDGVERRRNPLRSQNDR